MTHHSFFTRTCLFGDVWQNSSSETWEENKPHAWTASWNTWVSIFDIFIMIVSAFTCTVLVEAVAWLWLACGIRALFWCIKEVCRRGLFGVIRKLWTGKKGWSGVPNILGVHFVSVFPCLCHILFTLSMHVGPHSRVIITQCWKMICKRYLYKIESYSQMESETSMRD